MSSQAPNPSQAPAAPPADAARPSARSQKAKAMLAGGLVLGIGGAVVLAAWNDSEFARGNFQAGSFNLEGSLDGTAWAEHSTVGSPGAMTFTVSPELLAPGDVVYGSFAVRLDDTTSNDAAVAVTSAATSGALVPDLSYELIQPGAFGCSDGTTGTEIIPAGTAVTATAGAASFDLAKGSSGNPGEPANLCFKVTAGTGIGQAQTSSVTWRFAATSTS